MAFLSLFSPPVNHYVKWFITEALLHSGSGPSHSQLFSPVTLRGRKKENILDKGPVSTSYGKLAAFAKVEIPITSHCEDAPKGSLATRNSAKVSTPLPDPQLRAKMLFSLLSASIYLVQSSPLLEPSKIPKMHLWDSEVLSLLEAGWRWAFCIPAVVPFRSSGSAWDALSVPENSLRTGTTVRRLKEGCVGVCVWAGGACL